MKCSSTAIRPSVMTRYALCRRPRCRCRAPRRARTLASRAGWRRWSAPWRLRHPRAVAPPRRRANCRTEAARSASAWHRGRPRRRAARSGSGGRCPRPGREPRSTAGPGRRTTPRSPLGTERRCWWWHRGARAAAMSDCGSSLCARWATMSVSRSSAGSRRRPPARKKNVPSSALVPIRTGTSSRAAGAWAGSVGRLGGSRIGIAPPRVPRKAGSVSSSSQTPTTSASEDSRRRATPRSRRGARPAPRTTAGHAAGR